MSVFSDEWTAASSNIDEFYGDQFLYRPMAQVDGKWIADPSRATATITAALDETAAFTDPVGERNASGMSKGIVSQVASSQAAIDLAANALPYAPRAKDRLVRVSDGATFEVSGAPRDHMARIVLRVVRLS